MYDEEKASTPAATEPSSPTPPPIPYSIFTSHQKALIVTLVAIAATFSGFASNIYFPAIPSIAQSLSVTPELVNLTVTSYMILQGLSPTIWGAVADVHGRRVTYIGTFMVFIGACIGLAETRHYYQLVILRCLQSAGSASTIAIGAGVIGDITTREERGGYMGIYQAGLLAPVAIGPILGGIFSQTLGWHAIFWFLAIYGVVFLIFLITILPETLRSKVGNGSIPISGLSNSLLGYLQRRKLSSTTPNPAPNPGPDTDTGALTRIPTTTSIRKSLPVDFLGPLKIIFTPSVTCSIFFLAIYYTVWQMIISILSTLFASTYALTELQIGLTFIGNGAGCIIGTLTTGKFLDADYRRIKASYTGPPGDFPLEKARLRTLWLWSGLQIASVLVFGWTLEYGVHLSVPIICTFVLGWCATSIISVVNTFLVDIFPKKSASATASLNLVRCLMGAGGTAAVLPIVNAIGIGWTLTMFSGVMGVGLGLVGVQMRLGGRWRKRGRDKEEEVDT